MAHAVLSIDEKFVVPILEEAARQLDDAGGETSLDFCSVHRIDAGGLRAMEEFTRLAEEKAVKVVLRGVNVDVYKTLVLAKLTRKLSFVS